MVSECTVRRLGNLPFDFKIGTCGTFMIDSFLTILLCFADSNERRRCRSLRRKTDDLLSTIVFEDFIFEDEFDRVELDRVAIPDSTHDHWMASLANYQGFPLILGGTDNNKLEMLDTIKNPAEWIQYEGTDYPYLNQ